MKKLLVICSALLLAATACDKVKTPRKNTNLVVGKNFIVKDNKSVSGMYKVLLEDYTGHTCGNCPKAAAQADTLANKYGKKIVVMAVHAGNYATVELPDYPDYYGTTAGETWFKNPSDGFGFASAGNPNGLVNRRTYPGNGLIEAYTKWSSTIDYALLNDPFTVQLNVTTYYDPNVRALNVSVGGTFITSHTNDVKVMMALVEDSIHGAQKDYRNFPDLNPNYTFNHMLRGTYNDQAWGYPFKTGPIATGDTARANFNGFAVNSKFNDNNLSVIVFAYDVNTFEVLQVEKVKIR